MVKCPFCQFDNEDGALFCEQCKSDLSRAAVRGRRRVDRRQAMPVAEARRRCPWPDGGRSVAEADADG